MADTHVPLQGSERPRKADAVRVGDVDPNSPVVVTVTVRHPSLPDPGPPIAREQLERDYGVRAQDADEVKRVLERFGLTISGESRATGSLIVSGRAAQVEAAFGPRLGVYRDAGDAPFRGREGEIMVPAELRGVVTGVFGLDERPVAKRRTSADAQLAAPDAPPARPLAPADLEQRYNFPPGGGAGQTIAIAEFGGGYAPDDVKAYCQAHGRPTPEVTIVPLGLAPLTPDQLARLPAAQKPAAIGASREVMMDVQVVAGLCPKATIYMVCAPFHQKGWIDLLDRVIAIDPPPVAVSVSWGMAEDAPDWSDAARAAIDDRLHLAALLGVTVCVATGDDGSGDQMQDDRAHVHFPASSPFTLAVGGTMLANGDEVGWWNKPGDRSQHGGGSTGGGVSVAFARPSWQPAGKVRSLNAGSIDGRIVPDVAALAGLPGYSLVFDGQPTLNGGTSAAAPLWAALIARVAAARGRAATSGFLTPLLYRRGPDGRVRGESALRDITEGNNASPHPGRGYVAEPGFDAVTGWGVPDGQALLDAL
jgi:kumamolisin